MNFIEDFMETIQGIEGFEPELNDGASEKELECLEAEVMGEGQDI